MIRTPPSLRRSSSPSRGLRTAGSLTLALLLVSSLPGCGASSDSGSSPDPAPLPTATPAPTPTPTPVQAAACSLTAPKIDCSTRPTKTPDLDGPLQDAINLALSTGGVAYPDAPGRVYDLDRFRSIVVTNLGAREICGAWDYGNVLGDEIYLRSADGCVVEQYDLITGDGSIRPAGKGTMRWQEDFGVPVPGPKPNFSKEGDTACSLPGDRSTFCLGIRNSPGEYGREVYGLMAQVVSENPSLFDTGDSVGDGNADLLRLPGYAIRNVDGYIAAVEAKLRANGFCAYIEKGDILKVKKVARGNIFHEEIDVVQTPASGGAYVHFVMKDRCHNAGF